MGKRHPIKTMDLGKSWNWQDDPCVCLWVVRLLCGVNAISDLISSIDFSAVYVKRILENMGLRIVTANSAISRLQILQTLYAHFSHSSCTAGTVTAVRNLQTSLTRLLAARGGLQLFVILQSLCCERPTVIGGQASL